jgi:hypothetical protein
LKEFDKNELKAPGQIFKARTLKDVWDENKESDMRARVFKDVNI